MATRDLVSPAVLKDFMKLEILMGTQKSHFAYRLAWDNSSSEKIPFLPLLLRDLVSAEEGNKSYMDADHHRINWKKFEIMGDVILGMQNAQKTPYPAIPKNEEIRVLVLDGKLVKDDDVSLQCILHATIVAYRSFCANLVTDPVVAGALRTQYIPRAEWWFHGTAKIQLVSAMKFGDTTWAVARLFIALEPVAHDISCHRLVSDTRALKW